MDMSRCWTKYCKRKHENIVLWLDLEYMKGLRQQFGRRVTNISRKAKELSNSISQNKNGLYHLAKW